MVFGDPTGQMVLEDIKDGFHFYSPMFQPGLDPLTLAFREGQRSVALWLVQTVKAAMDADQQQESYTQEEYDGGSSS